MYRTPVAGAPTAKERAGTSRSTTELAPMTAPFPDPHAGADDDVLAQPRAILDHDGLHLVDSLTQDRGLGVAERVRMIGDVESLERRARPRRW